MKSGNKRIPEGVYPMVAPEDNAKWRQPKIGGKVSHRGVRIHYGGKMLSRGQKAGLLFLPTTSPNTMELLIQSRSLRRPLRILIDYWERAHYLMNMNILIQKQGE